MMRIILALSVFTPLVLGFAPQVDFIRTNTALEAISRRDALASGASALLVGITGVPKASWAFSQQLDERLVEPSQMSTGGKYDLNSAFVVSLKIIF